VIDEGHPCACLLCLCVAHLGWCHVAMHIRVDRLAIEIAIQVHVSIVLNRCLLEVLSLFDSGQMASLTHGAVSAAEDADPGGIKRAGTVLRRGPQVVITR